MNPPRLQPVRLQPQPSSRKKVQLIYKLFLLGNAWNTLKGKLRNFIHEAYEEAQSFLNSSFTTCEFSDLLNALDKKCEAIEKLSALLKDLVVEPQACVRPAVKTGLITNHIQPLLKTDVLKFGPMLQNRLMASSIAKAVQVFGATLSPQQLKHFIISQPAVVQENDMICSISPSCNSTDQTFSTAGHLKDDEKKQAVIFEESQPDPLILPPSIIKSPETGPERSPQLEPTIQAIFPEISNPNPMNITPLIGSGWEEDPQVQHQKQTSSQLLHFLRARTKIMGALEVTVTQWSKSAHTSGTPQSTSPAFKTQRYQSRRVVTDGVMEAPAPTMLCANIENEAPVFRVKTVESCGSLTYTCVIATKTELWDMGDIVTEVQQAQTDDSLVKDEDCQNTATQVANSSVNSHLKPQTPQGSAPTSMSKSACAKTPAVTGVTIPMFHTRKFEEIEVVVSYIVSPGNFYIQHADSTTKLRALVTDSWKASSSYAEQNCIPDIGTQVMGWFPEQGQWCRAQVTKICGISRDINCTDGAGGEVSMKVEVKMLDYGGTSCLSLLNVKELTPEMAILPLQAVQVSLANVTPVSGRDWSKEAVGWFKTMVNNRTLYARLYPQGPTVTVELFLEKGKLGAMRRGASLSLRLAQNGHAKHTKLKNIGPVKRSTIQLKMTKQDSDWEKYLISHYTQHKK